MAISKPNLTKWIDENRQFEPLLGIKIYRDSGDYIVMIVAGPNARKDFHNETEELFYQLEGSIKSHYARGWRA
jgi:3-hydroxyanthranilate 3,4-dioxygenase